MTQMILPMYLGVPEDLCKLPQADCCRPRISPPQTIADWRIPPQTATDCCRQLWQPHTAVAIILQKRFRPHVTTAVVVTCGLSDMIKAADIENVTNQPQCCLKYCQSYHTTQSVNRLSVITVPVVHSTRSSVIYMTETLVPWYYRIIYFSTIWCTARICP